jgi:hypothetical protein
LTQINTASAIGTIADLPLGPRGGVLEDHRLPVGRDPACSTQSSSSQSSTPCAAD